MAAPVIDEQAALTLELSGDGVAWLVFDRPESRVNLLTSGVMRHLDALLGEIEALAARGAVRTLVIRSGKAGTFIVGADVNEIADIVDPEVAAAGARAGQRVFDRLEQLPVPTIAAVDGTCLGGGTELILACDYRIATERAETKIGLPEIQLGIIPGFGGTTRLPRLIGLRAALELILGGKPVDARKAQRIGLVHERVPASILLTRAAALAADPDALHGLIRRKRSRSLATLALERNPLGRRVLFRASRKQVLARAGGHYPAPFEALRVMRESYGKPLAEALELEARAIGRLVGGDVSRNLLHVYYLIEAAKKSAPADAPASPVDQAAVLGAGVMGGGIAQLFAYHDIGVRLKDVQAEALGRGLAHARSLFDDATRRRRLPRRDARRKLGLIAPTLRYDGLRSTDIVIEAVVERLDVKIDVLRETEARVRPDCVLCSNTSSLSITTMQKALARPDAFCGMHFFNPVHRMPLVEVVRGELTSNVTIATVFALARRIGKTPLIVNDGPGFLVNRVLAPYLNEAGWLLADGASVERVDRVLKAFGMPMGPFRLLDEVGLDVAQHAGQTMYDAFGERLRPAPILLAMKEAGLLGKKGGRGFYEYAGDERKNVNPELAALSGGGEPRAGDRDVDDIEIRDRLVLAMVNEAARVLADGIVPNAGAVDLGMIMGTGFPPFRGGLLRYADTQGLPAVLGTLERFADRFGPRFQPAALLRERASAGRGFYD